MMKLLCIDVPFSTLGILIRRGHGALRVLKAGEDSCDVPE